MALAKLHEHKVDALVFYLSSYADYHELVRIRQQYLYLPILVMKMGTALPFKRDVKFQYVDVNHRMSAKELSALLESNMQAAYKLVGAL
jgi:hypothetical protein